MRSWYACAVGQCGHVKTMTRMSAFANLLSVYVLPSMPGSENGGMAEPIGSVGGWSAALTALAIAIISENTNPRVMHSPLVFGCRVAILVIGPSSARAPLEAQLRELQPGTAGIQDSRMRSFAAPGSDKASMNART